MDFIPSKKTANSSKVIWMFLKSGNQLLKKITLVKEEANQWFV
jgi:hypothetical protein